MSVFSIRGRRPCPHCAEAIRPEAIVCRFCSREVPSASVVTEAVVRRRLQNPVSALTRLLGGIPTIIPVLDWRLAFTGTTLLLVALYCIKHFFTFSLSNATLLLFMPLGPLAIGFILDLILNPPKRAPFFGLWAAVYVMWCLLVFVADQYFAYLHDGQGVGFGWWYSWVVENRSLYVKARHGPLNTVDRVGVFGYVLELVKIAGILYPGFSSLRMEWRRSRR